MMAGRGRWWVLLLALSALMFGLTSGPFFAWLAWRLRSRWLAVEAAVYLALTCAWIALSASHPHPSGSTSTATGVIVVALSVVACARGVFLWRRVGGLLPLRDGASSATAIIGGAGTTSSWSSAPSVTCWPPELGLSSPGGDCDGQDRHQLGMSTRSALYSGMLGAILLAVLLLLGVTSFRALAYAVTLLLMCVLALLFARWLAGPTLYYRVWGRRRALSLPSVTAVTVLNPGKRFATVALISPELRKPLRVSLQRSKASRAALQHLRMWLASPNIQWSPEAVGMFERALQPVRVRRRVRIAYYAWMVVVLGAAAAAFILARNSSPRMTPPSGFSSGTAQAPATGTWSATATTISSEGYSNDPPGSTTQRLWTIKKTCQETCTYTLFKPIEEMNGDLYVGSARLTHEADGWHLTWPAQPYPCHGPQILWYQHTDWIMRFTDGGHAAQVHATSFSYSPRCGYGKDSVQWNAVWDNRYTPTGIMSLVGIPRPTTQP